MTSEVIRDKGFLTVFCSKSRCPEVYGRFTTLQDTKITLGHFGTPRFGKHSPDLPRSSALNIQTISIMYETLLTEHCIDVYMFHKKLD